MTLQDIVDYARYRLNNYEIPYYWVDKELVFYCNEILNQMCRDARMLTDSITASVCEIYTTADTLDYALSPLVIFVKSARIVTQEVMTLDTLPSTAWSVGDTITGGTSTKTCKVVEKLTNYKYVINKRSGAFSLGETLTNGIYTAHQSDYYPKLSDYKSSELEKTDSVLMDSKYIGWRAETAAEPKKYILDYNTGYITLYPNPDDSYLLRLSVIRYPLVAMSVTSMSTQTPEIDAKYHDTVVNGICSMAYMKRGENTFNDKLASMYLSLYKKSISDMKVKDNLTRTFTSIGSPHKGFI